jgi:glycosyltransferase involved in cell wall biosynthesis
MRISIVIPTYNRARLLAQTLPALATQQLRPGLSYEVIFVSNGSPDDTGDVVAQAIAQHPGVFRYFRIDATGGPSAPRNRGIREASGEVVVILDDDVRPDPDLVLRYAEFHERHPASHVAAVGETYVPQHLLSDPMSLFHVFPYDKMRGHNPVSYLFFWTCNVSFKRSFMLERGMFDEKFLYNEDVICGYKLHHAGMELHFVEAARGEHLHQLKASGLPAKGTFTGRWIYATVQAIRAPEVLDRYGVLAPEIGPLRYLKRLANRAVFRIVDNPLTHLLLRSLGAERGHRSRWSDMYYYLLFRRHIVAGYHQARQEARRQRSEQARTADKAWVDRGEG